MSWNVRPGGSIVVTVRLTLRPGMDDDLIAILQQAQKGKLAAIVRETMRSGIIRPRSGRIVDDAQEKLFECESWEL
jgi:hypothetical protein